MKKFILIAILLMSANCVFAERIPIKLVPAQNISTCYDEIEPGDKIMFMPINNPKINIKPNTPIIGVVDYIQQNGWMTENAEIQFKDFIITLDNGKTKTYKSSLTINGFEELKTRYPKSKRFFEYIPVFIRGKEIDIRKGIDKPVYNIWISF